MRKKVYKAMDGELNFFGIRGSYRRYLFAGFGVAVVLGLAVGSMWAMLAGVLTFIGGCGAVYMFIVFLQQKYDFASLHRYLQSRRLPIYVYLRKPFRKLWK